MKAFFQFFVRCFVSYLASVLVISLPAYWLVTSNLVGGQSLSYAVPGVGYWLALGFPQKVHVIVHLVLLPEIFRGVALGFVLFLVRPFFRGVDYWGAVVVGAVMLLIASLNEVGQFLRNWIASSASASAPGWEHPSRTFYLLIAESAMQYVLFALLLMAWEKKGALAPKTSTPT
jgi:hypothetical protein